jgi:hypothetical protein
MFRRFRDDIHSIALSLREIARLLARSVATLPATRGYITQEGKEDEFMINGVQVGGQGTFKFTPNGALSPTVPPKWSTGDPSVLLTPSADGLTCVAQVGPGETLPSFGLAVLATASDGSTFNTNASVPVLAKVVPATAGTIDQVA